MDPITLGDRGLILGKFMPPHAGHLYAIGTARRLVQRLTVLVCSLPDDPIPGALRFDWVRGSFPECDVRHVQDVLPQEPRDSPDFWPRWKAVIRRELGSPPDIVFASEAYGFDLATHLGGRFIPIDLERNALPVSGTAVRKDPLHEWRWLPHFLRARYAKRICLFGPESTGKTTLAARLAAQFDTVWVPEFARGLLDHREGRCDLGDIAVIAAGQAATEDELAAHANRVLFCDTDPLLTTVWSDVLFGSCPPAVHRMADRHYDLTLLLDVDVPWIDDGQRYLADRRSDFMSRCISALDQRHRTYAVLRGSYDERYQRAVELVRDLIGEGRSVTHQVPPGPE